jgi:hypothetical protein
LDHRSNAAKEQTSFCFFFFRKRRVFRSFFEKKERKKLLFPGVAGMGLVHSGKGEWFARA